MNQRCQPFRWTEDADQILTKLKRQNTSGTHHCKVVATTVQRLTNTLILVKLNAPDEIDVPLLRTKCLLAIFLLDASNLQFTQSYQQPHN
jgi:hypothetical protein